MIRYLKSVFLLTIALAVDVPALAALPEKIFIGTGWDTLRKTPEEVLEESEAFSQTGLDGINLVFEAKNSDGEVMNQDRVLSRVRFSYPHLRRFIPLFQKIAKCKGLKESLLTVRWCPTPEERLSWDDDEGWKIFEENMRVVARLAREGGLKGILLDWEDYKKARQFERIDSDPAIDKTVVLARKRGNEIGKAVFSEYPDIVFFSYWWLSTSSWWLGCSLPAGELQKDELAYALKRSVWVAFFNGVLDVLPDGAQLVDGCEKYQLESSRRDFYCQGSDMLTSAQALVYPENRKKYRQAVSAAHGHYIDMYVNDEESSSHPQYGKGYWYFGPEGGSRLEHFRRNVLQSARSSSQYVWFWGEKGVYVPLSENARRYHPWLSKQKTWQELLPGWQEVIKKIKCECNDVNEMPKAKMSEPKVASMSVSSASQSQEPDMQGAPPKKFIASGRKLRSMSAKDILKNADLFAALGFDGVAVAINSGSLVFCEKSSKVRLRQQLNIIKQFRSYDGLKESLIYVSLSPRRGDKVSWNDDIRWSQINANVRMMAALAKAAGLKGVFLDSRDHNLSGQFSCLEKSASKGFCYDRLAPVVRRRGREFGNAIFAAYPDIVLFSVESFAVARELADCSSDDFRSEQKKSGSLWPEFIAGIAEVLPPTAMFVDGGGARTYDAKKNDYYMAAADARIASRMLTGNELKGALSIAFGDSLDRYQRGAEDDFRENLTQAVRSSCEYVWLETDRHNFVGKGSAKLIEAFPDWCDIVWQVKDERQWIKRYLKMHADCARNIVLDSSCERGIGQGGFFGYIDRSKTPDAVIDTDVTVGEGDNRSIRMKGCGRGGTFMYRVVGVKPGDVYAVFFSTKGYPISAQLAWLENGAFRWNIPVVRMPMAIENAAGWRTCARVVRAPIEENYNEMYLMVDMPGSRANDVAWIDNVYVYKIKEAE